jgi:XTP/dITP diphosphohydrolase
MNIDIVFATGNEHKVREVQALLPHWFHIRSLHDLNYYEEIPETGKTLEENARIKAEFAHQLFNFNCFSEDTGLEVHSLNNAPGVYSARYAGSEKSSQKNIEKLLNELNDKGIDRQAQFRTCIALIIDGQNHLFEGKVKGIISNEQRGLGGFGYDSVFIPEGYKTTFAEMTQDQKQVISHRADAMKKLILFLKEYAINKETGK